MARLTKEDIQKINEVYYIKKTYSAVAKELGFSPATVKKYIISGWEPTVKKDFPKFNIDSLPEDFYSIFVGVANFGELCILNEDEQEEMKKLWEEMVL